MTSVYGDVPQDALFCSSFAMDRDETMLAFCSSFAMDPDETMLALVS